MSFDESETNKKRNAKRLLELFPSTSAVEIEDSAEHELFGSIVAPQDVLNALFETASTDEENRNVGIPTLQSSSSSLSEKIQSQTLGNVTYLNSQWQSTTSNNFPVRFQNDTTRSNFRIRWIDIEGGIHPSTHQWNVLPSQHLQQYTQPGHFFLISYNNVVAPPTSLYDEDEESLVFGYRAKRPLPSENPLIIKVSTLIDNVFLVETSFDDPFDVMTVATGDLDWYRDGPQRTLLQHTVKLLSTILSNLIYHPTDIKYQKLRLNNPKIQQYIEASWSAMELLRVVGFERTMLLPSDHKGTNDSSSSSSSTLEPYLQMPSGHPFVELCQLALRMVQLLQSRLAPGFVSDLAPLTPWQPVVATAASSTRRGGFNNGFERGWLSEEERWERIQRNNQRRRSGAARRPEPGNAPSSRGNWGR